MSPRCVVYCRISQDRLGEGAGVERQRKDCERLAGELGWTVVEVFTDNDVSAYSRKPRPQYRRMLDRISSGDVDGVLAWHTDRLYRSIPDLTELIELCDERHVEIRTCRAGEIDLSTPSGRLSATMFASIARYEVERSAERIKSAKDQQALDGKFRGGPRPFGYKDGGMELEPREADALRDAATHVLAGGSMMSITKQWNRDGITTARGKRWTVTALRKVLMRGRNAGLVEQGDKVVGDARWPAIFDLETLNAIRGLLNDPSRRTAFSYERKHQGSGVYRCGKCGGPMKVFKGASDGRDYRCVDRPHLSCRMGPLDEFVSEVVIARLSLPDAVDAFKSHADDDTWRLQGERDGLKARKDELASLFAAGTIDGSQLATGSASLQEQIDRIDARLADARKSSPVSDLVMADDVRVRWSELAADVRGKVIDALMVVTVLPVGSGARPRGGGLDPGRVDVAWRT